MPSINVNGEKRDYSGDSAMPLLWFLRDELNLTGTKYGCGAGVCGACTVLCDGEPVRACLMLGVQANGKEIITIEGLADGDELSPIQTAFRKHHGLQCGYCTPGMITRAAKLLEENPSPTEEDIRFGMSGNLCRCTGYQNIVKSILAAAAEMNAAKEAAE